MKKRKFYPASLIRKYKKLFNTTTFTIKNTASDDGEWIIFGSPSKITKSGEVHYKPFVNS